MSHNKKRRLKTGFTTGTAAAAATKAALSMLLEKQAPQTVDILLLTGDRIPITVNDCRVTQNTAICTVVKDAGDDPDVTHKALIGAKVTLATPEQTFVPQDSVIITGGLGVGTVTKPGLEIPPGEPAINPGPRRMIREAVKEVLSGRHMDNSIRVEIFVPRGEELARKTLNGRLGIIGGLSILGTTGLVKPMSHAAYTATIRSAMDVAMASGNNGVVLTTGRRSERFAQNFWPGLPEETFIQIGDYFQKSLNYAAQKQFATVTLAVFFGKAVKMAQGVPHTHAAKSRLTLDQLANWTIDLTENEKTAETVRSANTARHALEVLRPNHPKVIERVGLEMMRSAAGFSGDTIKIQGVIFDYDGSILFESKEGK